MSKVGGFSVVAAILAVLFYFFDLNHVGIQEIGIAYDSWSGEIAVQHTGWHVTGPQVQVASVSLLPTQVCLNSGARVLNCKLVRFNETGVQDFIREQGFHYYGNSNFSSNNNSSCYSACSGVPNILKGYAYSGRQWKFLEILEEISPQTPPQLK